MDDMIIEAIQNKKMIKFTYHGLYRIAEPHIFGYCKGVKQLLVYQIGGQSQSGQLPDWRRLLVHEISQLIMLDESFPGHRPYPSGEHSPWDSYIAVVR